MDGGKGRCMCGRVTFEFEGPVIWCGHCHCESCRRATSSPFTTWVGVKRATFRLTGAEPGVYQSSPGVNRRFCTTCGAPVSFESERWPDETHLYASALDNPERFAPQFHVQTGEQLPWVKLADGLPRYQRNIT